MEKTKLGISMGLLGALTFLSPLFGTTAMVFICGYVLLKEENEVLRKNAVLVLTIFAACELADFALNIIPRFNGVINLKGWQYEVALFGWIDAIFGMFIKIVDFARDIVLVIFAILAFFKKPVNIKAVDKLTND